MKDIFQRISPIISMSLVLIGSILIGAMTNNSMIIVIIGMLMIYFGGFLTGHKLNE